MMVASGCFTCNSLRPVRIKRFVAITTAFTVAKHPYVSTVDMLRIHDEAKKAG